MHSLAAVLGEDSVLGNKFFIITDILFCILLCHWCQVFIDFVYNYIPFKYLFGFKWNIFF